jgi:hypothetical protein
MDTQETHPGAFIWQLDPEADRYLLLIHCAALSADSAHNRLPLVHRLKTARYAFFEFPATGTSLVVLWG